MACGFDSRLRHHEFSTPVFVHNGKPIKSLRIAFENSCKRVNLKSVSFHTLRHIFATRLVLTGVDIATVSKPLGHSSIHMTMRYSHPTPEALKNAVSVLDGQKSGKTASKSVSAKID
ncbi:MAG: tyrosine-type recombinase/integrase [Thermodesulfobacteriota bacterium]